MDRKARNSVSLGPSIHGGTGSGRPTGIISPADLHAGPQSGDDLDSPGSLALTRLTRVTRVIQ
jgi:hypothetical protein